MLEIKERADEKKRRVSLQTSKGTKRNIFACKKAKELFSSSGSKDDSSFVSDSSDAESFSEFEFEKYQSKPEVNSYVLYEFHDKRAAYFVDKIIDIKYTDFEVTFLRHSAKKTKPVFFLKVVSSN